MMKLIQLSTLLLAATTVGAGKPQEECQNGHTCDCFTCGDVSVQNDGSLQISIDHCKGDDISWICCTAVDGEEGKCDVETCGSAKCEGMASGEFTISVPGDASTFTINTHDGKTQGDALNVREVCGGPPGGQGGSCAVDGHTAHCLIDFDIAADCGYTPSDPEPEPVDDPEPEPVADPEPEPVDDPEPEPVADPEPEPEEKGPTPAPQPKASGSGDPHFKTWSGAKYDYHGECDLVLVDNPTFANGLGLRVHIRTTSVKYFSFISKVALQIGDDILEFDNDVENFLINGVQAPPNQKHHKTMLGGFLLRRDPKALSLRLDHDGKAKIDFHTRKNGFPAVIVDGGNTDIFKGSLGLLGDWATGKRLARDGQTELEGEDATDFALEWQVRDTEPMLFTEARFPQFPSVCLPPKAVPNRLGSSSFTQEAEEACAHWKHDFEDCVFDVIATRDVLVAEEGHIVHVE